eukprot:scaffold1368_cov333-Pavlova_lutheri.AAC.35
MATPMHERVARRWLPHPNMLFGSHLQTHAWANAKRAYLQCAIPFEGNKRGVQARLTHELLDGVIGGGSRIPSC